MYTIKPTGCDKKVFLNIEKKIQKKEQVEKNWIATLPQSQQGYRLDQLKQSFESPFGNLLQKSSRFVFACMVNILNAAHNSIDYHTRNIHGYNRICFEDFVKASDFKLEPKLANVVQIVDTEILSLQPKPVMYQGAPRWETRITPHDCDDLRPTQRWNRSMWNAINSEMNLEKCTIYSYKPSEDHLEATPRVLDSYHFLFYNKEMKRVCYLWWFRRYPTPEFDAGEDLEDPGSLSAGSWDEDDLGMYASSFEHELVPRIPGHPPKRPSFSTTSDEEGPRKRRKSDVRDDASEDVIENFEMD